MSKFFNFLEGMKQVIKTRIGECKWILYTSVFDCTSTSTILVLILTCFTCTYNSCFVLIYCHVKRLQRDCKALSKRLCSISTCTSTVLVDTKKHGQFLLSKGSRPVEISFVISL